MTEWVRGALVTELDLNGYRAELGDASKAPADQIVVTGQIQKTLTKAYFSYNSEIDLSADVKRGNATLIKNNYVGKGGGGINMAATASGFGRSIALALQDALHRLVADIAKFAGKPK